MDTPTSRFEQFLRTVAPAAPSKSLEDRMLCLLSSPSNGSQPASLQTEDEIQRQALSKFFPFKPQKTLENQLEEQLAGEPTEDILASELHLKKLSPSQPSLYLESSLQLELSEDVVFETWLLEADPCDLSRTRVPSLEEHLAPELVHSEVTPVLDSEDAPSLTAISRSSRQHRRVNIRWVAAGTVAASIAIAISGTFLHFDPQTTDHSLSGASVAGIHSEPSPIPELAQEKRTASPSKTAVPNSKQRIAAASKSPIAKQKTGAPATHILPAPPIFPLSTPFSTIGQTVASFSNPDSDIPLPSSHPSGSDLGAHHDSQAALLAASPSGWFSQFSSPTPTDSSKSAPKDSNLQKPVDILEALLNGQADTVLPSDLLARLRETGPAEDPAPAKPSTQTEGVPDTVIFEKVDQNVVMQVSTNASGVITASLSFLKGNQVTSSAITSFSDLLNLALKAAQINSATNSIPAGD